MTLENPGSWRRRASDNESCQDHETSFNSVPSGCSSLEVLISGDTLSENLSDHADEVSGRTLHVAVDAEGAASPYVPDSRDSGDELSTKQTRELSNVINDQLDVNVPTEKSWLIALQVFFPFLAAGFGTVFAGLLLDHVQHWSVFVQVPEVFILVPALLGLKGNLEMTLASRLSTAANIGILNCPKDRLLIIYGNLVLTQVQALVVAALAASCAMVFRWVAANTFDVHHAFLLCASSLITASVASLLLGGFMVMIIILSKKVGINPDNVATPIAASLGDVVTLAFLSLTSQFLFTSIGSRAWIAPLLCSLCMAVVPLWVYISYHNKFTKAILSNGWMPVILGMAISSAGGVIFSVVVVRYNGVAVFSPVINGVGGNLVAVQASRLATHLHFSSSLGVLPANVRYGCIKTFCTGGGHSRTARVLMFMSVPGHLVFLGIVYSLRAGHRSTTPLFVVVYLLAGFIQVAVLLFVCNWLVHFLWKRKLDPDNHAIPYLTALGDLLGTALLGLAFHILHVIGNKDADGGD